MRPFGSSDLDDLHQELRAAWLTSRECYDARRGTVWPLLKTVTERKAGKIREKALAQCRYTPGLVSLDDISSRPDSRKTGDPTGDRRRSLKVHSVAENADLSQLSVELESVIHELPTPLAELCVKLMTQTPAEIARATGTPPSTVSSRIALIRRRFESKKLSEYL
jgi:DNA-directed RNA polymerase specialized sigma24 family protein